MALPGNRGAVQLITRHGHRFHAHAAGQKQGIDMAHPEVHVHLRPGVMFDPGDGMPHVDVHDAYHNNPKSLPPALMALIVEAVERYLAQQNVHEKAGVLPGGAPAPVAPTPAAMPMMGGAGNPQGGSLPGNRMPMAA